MNELLRERLISLLSDASQVANEEIQSAYGNFMEQLRTASQSETDYSEVYRMLNITRAELEFLKSLYRHEQGKKRLEICLFSKSFRPY